MATVEAKVFSHHLKKDGTYNVKIRVFHKNESRFVDTVVMFAFSSTDKIKKLFGKV